ncbi:TPA: hypothetical protein ACR6RP_005896, partial [Klebsiella pneumoniae]
NFQHVGAVKAMTLLCCYQGYSRLKNIRFQHLSYPLPEVKFSDIRFKLRRFRQKNTQFSSCFGLAPGLPVLPFANCPRFFRVICFCLFSGAAILITANNL